ncbi:cupin domain-containing protein [Streptomyces sp. NPDC046985]|uniref:cupin domain-containing protein n=1 Tax=Streptomyces sp. NPDC046985 TaxID=3155377 RepID=UPI0033CE6825
MAVGHAHRSPDPAPPRRSARRHQNAVDSARGRRRGAAKAYAAPRRGADPGIAGAEPLVLDIADPDSANADFPGAALHAVARGTAWLDPPGKPTSQLTAGDLLLLPPGTEHGLTGEPGTRMGACDQASAQRSREHGEALTLGSPPRTTELITLHYRQDPEVSTPVLPVLGSPLHVSARQNPVNSFSVATSG